MAFAVSPKGSTASITVAATESDKPGGARRAAPLQAFDDLADMRIALARKVRAESVAALNLILADTMTLRDLYKKHHWQTSGATFYELRLLFDKHHDEQGELVDAIAERIQTLGGCPSRWRPTSRKRRCSRVRRGIARSHCCSLYG